MKRWLWIIGGIVVVAISMTVVLQLTSNTQAQEAVTEKVTEETLDVTIEGSGFLVYEEADRLLAMTPSDAVSDVLVEEGDRVEEGDELLTLTSGETLTSPRDGVVNQLGVAAGEQVSQGQLLVEVVNPDTLAVEVMIDEVDRPDVEAGQKVDVSITAYPVDLFTGTVQSVSNAGTVENGVSRFAVTIVLDEQSDAELYSGLTAEAAIQAESIEDAKLIPLEATTYRDQRYFVTVVEGEKETEREIVIGVIREGMIEVRSGLETGEEVKMPVAAESSETSSFIPPGPAGS